MSTRLDYTENLINTEIQELILRKNYIEDDNIETIYFGGGTPSVIEKKYIEKLLRTIYDNYKVVNNIEITLECNPEDIVDISKLQYYKNIGINRLSVGIQSFKKKTLNFINRNDNIDNIYKCIDNINVCKFDNFNIDLIFGIFNEDFEDLQYNLEEILKIKPKHISIYCLSIEDKTYFKYKIKNKELQTFDDDYLANMYLYIDKILTKNGYIHYEISNFCLEGYESKHNCNYWNNNIKYLGIGPGAHSYNIKSRQYNIENNHIYMKNIKNKILSENIEILNKNNKINEYIFTNIRTNKGLNIEILKNLYNYNTDMNFINELIKNKYIEFLNNTIILKPKGMFISDSIIKKLMI